MNEAVRTSQVFVPGKLPAYTYNPRSEFQLEQKLNDYVEEAGAVLTLAGPTKTGKSVLLRRIIQNPVWVDGQGIETVDELWRRIGDALQIYTAFETGTTATDTTTARATVTGTILPGFLTVAGGGDYASGSADSVRYSVDRPITAPSKDALLASGRPLVVDDFHFVARDVQREVVRALKPAVFRGRADHLRFDLTPGAGRGHG
jgi:hypothetical protein